MKKSHFWILIFNLLYMLIFASYYIVAQNYEFLIYISVIVIIGLIIGVNLKRSHLDDLTLWLLSIWGLAHLIAGGVRVNGNTIYSLHLIDIVNKGGQFYILKMDQLIHFYGFLVAALVVYQLIKATGSNASNSPRLMIFLAWVGSMGLGALNEVIEFIAFISLSQTGVGDVYNTGLDLIFNLLGSIVGAFIASKLYRKSKK